MACNKYSIRINLANYDFSIKYFYICWLVYISQMYLIIDSHHINFTRRSMRKLLQKMKFISNKLLLVSITKIVSMTQCMSNGNFNLSISHIFLKKVLLIQPICILDGGLQNLKSYPYYKSVTWTLDMASSVRVTECDLPSNL